MSVIISKKIVKKKFPADQSSLFLNEIFWLRKLKNFKIVPKIIHIDYVNQIISISHEGDKINAKNKPKDWKRQLEKILIILKKINCFHCDIKPDNLLVKKNKLVLIDFAQSISIKKLKLNFFSKKRIFYDDYAINRIDLSINKNIILSNDLRTMIIWDAKYKKSIEKRLNKNKNIKIIDKIKIKKNFYKEKFKNRVFWIDQFYNKNVSKKSEKLKNNIYVYILQSIDPVFKIKKMIFNQEKRIVDDKIFEFKKKVRNNKFSIIHIADNFEESKRNAIFLSKSKDSYPAKYFINTQYIYRNKKEFFAKLNNSKHLKYLVLREQISDKEDLDILTNDYYTFKRIADCQSYKTKKLNFISNNGDPIEESGIKVSNYIKVQNKKIFVDLRYIGDNYFDTKWQKEVIKKKTNYSNYFIPDKNNRIFLLFYHIVYHKGYIHSKYFNIIQKNLKTNLKFDLIKKKLDLYLKKNKYEITRPNDLTIPIPYKINKNLFNLEIKNITSQINNRNHSGANKMIYNILKFQKKIYFFKFKIFSLIILNQFLIVKNIFKKLIFRYFI